jgi:hypothetical protein
MAYRVRACPNVCRTHAIYVDAYSIYIVQELLVGGSLQALYDAHGKLDDAEAAAALRGVLGALAACHEEGICYGGARPPAHCRARPPTWALCCAPQRLFPHPPRTPLPSLPRLTPPPAPPPTLSPLF